MPVFGPVTVIGHFQPIILFLSSTQIFNSKGKTVSFWPLQRKANADRIILVRQALVRQTGNSQNVGRKWCPGWESNPSGGLMLRNLLIPRNSITEKNHKN